MSEPNAEFVRFYCQCETKLKVPKAAAGKRVQCPKCGFKLVVPASSSTEPLRDASPQLEPPSTLEDGDGLLDDLMSLEQAAETTGQRSVVESQKPCPNCGVSLSPEAAMCLACGRDLSAQKEAKKSPKAAAVAGGLAKRGGRFALGCTLSGAGALIGAVVWTVVCFVTGYEFSLIAWGVGLLAGYGMALGYGKQNGKAGIVATLMAGGGVLAAKIMIFSFVLYAVFTGDTDNVDFQREFLKVSMVEEKLDEQGLYSDDERDSKWDVFYEEATVEVEELSDEEVRDKCAAMQAEEAESALADQRFRLADHRAELRADGMGMLPYSSKREELRDEEMEAVRQLSAEDLDGAIAELEHWEEKGRWSSPQYVTNFLVYERAREEMLAAYEDTGEDEEEFDEEKDAAEWKKHYDKAMSEVTELSLQDQLSKAKAMEEERQREHDRFLAELEERFATQDDEDSFDDEEGIVSLFFSSMFGPFDAICIMLAMYSAFKLGLGEAS